MFSVVESSNFLVYDLSPDLLSYTSNTMGVTCGEGTAYHPGTPTGSSPVYSMCHVTQFLLFYLVTVLSNIDCRCLIGHCIVCSPIYDFW